MLLVTTRPKNAHGYQNKSRKVEKGQPPLIRKLRVVVLIKVEKGQPPLIRKLRVVVLIKKMLAVVI